MDVTRTRKRSADGRYRHVYRNDEQQWSHDAELDLVWWSGPASLSAGRPTIAEFESEWRAASDVSATQQEG